MAECDVFTNTLKSVSDFGSDGMNLDNTSPT